MFPKSVRKDDYLDQNSRDAVLFPSPSSMQRISSLSQKINTNEETLGETLQLSNCGFYVLGAREITSLLSVQWALPLREANKLWTVKPSKLHEHMKNVLCLRKNQISLTLTPKPDF